MTWRELLRRPRRVDTVMLTGLAIAIPPSPGEGQPRFPKSDETSRDSSAKTIGDVVAHDVASEPARPAHAGLSRTRRARPHRRLARPTSRRP